MQNSEEKRNIELNSKQKSGWIKIALVVVIAAAAVYGYRTWSGGKAVQQQTAQAAEPLVIVKPVEKADSSSQPSEYVGRVEAIQTVQVKPQISGEIAKVSYMDGCKVYFKNGGWVIARFSGTEPLLRVFCEMDTMENAEKIAKILTEFLSL